MGDDNRVGRFLNINEEDRRDLRRVFFDPNTEEERTTLPEHWQRSRLLFPSKFWLDEKELKHLLKGLRNQKIMKHDWLDK